METQTRLSRHNKFISAENIVGIFSVSSDDLVYIYIYIYIYINTDTNDFVLFWFNILVYACVNLKNKEN